MGTYGSGDDLVVTLEWGELSDDLVIRAARQIPEGAFRETGLEVKIGGTDAVLLPACDSAEDGDRVN